MGDIKDPQCIDFETKITEFDPETADVLKIICSSTKEEPYCFTIAIDTVRIPFSVVDLLESLEPSNFDEIKSTIRSEILEKKWRTRQDGPLKAKPLAFKLRNVVNSMERAAILAKGKTTTGRTALDVSGVTQTRSQVQSQASGRGRAKSATARATSTPRASYDSLSPSSPARKRPGSKQSAERVKKKSKLISEEDLSTAMNDVVGELPKAHQPGEVVDYNNINMIYQKFFSDCTDAFVFEDKPQKKMEIDVMKLKNAPHEWTIRAFEQRGMEELKNFLMNMPDRSQKQTLCVMPDMEFKPTDESEMQDCDFFIINGQHSVAASKAMIQGNVPEAIRKDFRTWHCFIVWTKDIEKLRKISAFYNRVNHLTPFKPTWATNILAARSVWKKYGRPQIKHAAAGVTDNRVTGRRSQAENATFEVNGWNHPHSSLARVELNCIFQCVLV